MYHLFMSCTRKEISIALDNFRVALLSADFFVYQRLITEGPFSQYVVILQHSVSIVLLKIQSAHLLRVLTHMIVEILYNL